MTYFMVATAFRHPLEQIVDSTKIACLLCSDIVKLSLPPLNLLVNFLSQLLLSPAFQNIGSSLTHWCLVDIV